MAMEHYAPRYGWSIGLGRPISGSPIWLEQMLPDMARANRWPIGGLCARSTYPFRVGVLHYYKLGFKDINDFKGMYALKVSSPDQNWISATKLIALSDIGLIVKASDDEVQVFANSLMTAESLSSVKINLVSSNNQVIYSAQTDSKGIAHIKGIKEKAPRFKVAMVSATLDKDFNFIVFDQNVVDNARYEVGGMRQNASGQQVYLYGDRNLYRPGETMYLHTIIRDEKWKNVGQVPIKLRVIAPNGKEFSAQRGVLNAQSAFDAQVDFPTATITGTYHVELYSANDILLASINVSVEEFMPDRIKLETKISKPVYLNGENLNLSATATNLFGPAAAGRNYEVSYSLSRGSFSAAAFPGYSFEVKTSNNPSFENVSRQGSTDANGKLQESFSMPATYQDQGLLVAKVFTTVFDESGRPVNPYCPVA
jgi:uncharacterized protein YfaS (alpha-2-macroglobulin family)